MRNRMFIIIVLLFWFAGSAMARVEDPGIPDTLIISSVQVDAGQKAIVECNFFNDELIGGMTVPIGWDSPDITLDSVSFVGSRVEHINTKPINYNPEDQNVVFGFLNFFEPKIPAGRGLLATLYFDIPSGTADQFVNLDTLTFGPANLLFNDESGFVFVPQVVQGKITIGDPPEFPHIELSPSSMIFDGIIGYANPSPKTLNITNSGGETLVWSATTAASWLSAHPPSGTAPSVTSIHADIVGLGVGTYIDSLEITAAGADNSPQYLVVTLNVTQLPPDIHFSPEGFNISAVQSGANPEDRYLQIWTEVPGSELNWSVSNSESWLTLTPSSGTPPDSLSLQIDISGLTFGIYEDIIVITDPEASNGPQSVPVTLQIVSDLPVLAFDVDTLHVIVPLGTTVDPGIVTVFNAGEGLMTYSATEGESWITGISPSSGTAPQDVSISFKSFPLSAGEYYSIVTFTSPEAINSPQDLVVHLHVTETPATIAVLPSALSFNYYDCWQGPFGLPPVKTFQVINTGGDLMHWWLTHNQSWLLISDSTGSEEKSIITASLDAEGLPLGTYVDTVTVYSNNAINSPKLMIVTLNVIPGSETPEIVVNNTTDTIPAQEVFGVGFGELAAVFEIQNLYPGCMDYWIEEDIPWLKFIDSIGSAPYLPKAVLEIGDYTYGIYTDSFLVHSPTAANSPVKLYIRLHVWRLHGDANWSNNINMADAGFIIDWIFRDGPSPIPEDVVGDANCDGFANMADVAYIIDWIFRGGDVPCGNPKK